MKSTTSLVWFLVAVVAFVRAADEKYTTKYDNINLDDVLQNERLYQKYLGCLKKTGKCTPDAQLLREILPEALRTRCAKCREHQKKAAERVMKYLLEKRPQDFAALEKIYDPQGTYRNMYRQDAAKRGIKI